MPKVVPRLPDTNHLHRKRIDDALKAIEKENPQLKGVANKTYTRFQFDPAIRSSLIELIATIS